MKSNHSYWANITYAVSSSWQGLRITLRHLLNIGKRKPPQNIQAQSYFSQPYGISTVQYPHETIPVPDNGRYRLHNEIDDCIVCDKCAKICPVDCIEIEPIRSLEEIGKTSDGTPKRIYAARFDIDMGKCCFCGLCTTVCPTECLTMTKVFDFSVSDIREHTYAFAEMSPDEIAAKKKALEENQKVKTPATNLPATDPPQQPRPTFKPRVKPPDQTPPSS